MRTSSIILLLIGLLLSPTLWAARAVFDRSNIFIDETVTLIVEVDRQVQGKNPDLSALEADFHVLGQRTSSQVQIINDRQTAQTHWVIQLEPKHSGDIRVPALTIDGEQTAPIMLKVKQRSTEDAKKVAESVFLEVQAEPQTPYVQSQIRYTVRFYYSVPLLEGSLDEPEPKDVVVQRLGEDIAYQTQRNGQNYNVIQRNYAIFPEKSGTLTLPAIEFRGRVAAQDRSQRRLLGRSSRRLRLSSDPLVIQVRPRPADYAGKHWLPSTKLTLEEHWPPESPQFRVGEPVTRTLTLNAQGLTTTQLPNLDIPEPPGIRIYDDQPTTEGNNDGSWVFSRQEQRLAVVPTTAGEFTLPEIRLRWWDTQNDKAQVAVIPERRITVLPAANSSTQASEPSTPTAIPTIPTSAPITSGIWPWISAFLLCLWLLTLTAWWRGQRSHRTKSTSPEESSSSAQARRRLRQACRDNNAHTAANALLDWATASWPQSPPHNLGAVAARLASGGESVRELDRCLYAPDPSAWQGAVLWQAVEKGLGKKRKTATHSTLELPPLYPQRGVP